MAALDPRIIMSGVGESVPLNDLSAVYNNALQFRTNRAALENTEEETRQRQVMNDAYKVATRADGTIDNGALNAHLAQNLAGGKIPTVQKANLELQKGQAEMKSKTAETGKTIQETLYNGLKLVDNTIASLATRQDVSEQMVYSEMGRLVSAGAFDVQAQHVGKDPDTYAREMLSTMPVGNPQALHSWLVQSGARVADATKRLELSLPKYDEQDRGSQINQGTVDQLTGQRTAGINVNKSVTPDAALSAETARRGQNLVDARTADYNAITKEAGASQVVETPQGFAVVNKGTANARPVAMASGDPVLGKDSVVAKNAQMADRLTGMIPLAKQLLTHSTGSGAGALVDKALAFTGQSTKGGDAATALETVSGWMTSNVPRFEGPQSDKDTATYRTMAGLVGDRTQPVPTRLKALETVEALMSQYSGHRTSEFSGPPGTAPATAVAPRPLVPSRTTAPATGAAPRAGTGGRPSIDSFFKQGQ